MLNRGIESCKTISTTIALLMLGGCASVQVESQSFRNSKDSSIESAQIATDADFSIYDRLLATEMGIFFPQSQTTPVDDLTRIRQIFRDAFLAELEQYQIVTDPGPSTMAVTASLIDMRTGTPEQVPHMRSAIREIAQPGSILFLMEMRDSMSDRVLARAADSAKAPTFSNGNGVETDWASIEEAAHHWAALFRTFLDENFAH